MKASINRLSCDKYTGANITEPLLPLERGGLSFIKTWGRTSLDEWHEWAKNTQPDNEGDVLIQALLRMDLEFIQHLCGRVFGFHAPNYLNGSSYELNRAALEILAACAWREGGHFVTFEVDRYSHKYPHGMGKRSRCANHKHIASLIWWANRNYSFRCCAANERQRLLDLVL